MSSSAHAIDTAASAPMDRWHTLPWKHFQRHVFKLQKRIYRASQRGTFAVEVRLTHATLLRSRMRLKSHVRFCSRAGVAPLRLRQRREQRVQDREEAQAVR
jgi:N-terminal domain of reverse transcriptase